MWRRFLQLALYTHCVLEILHCACYLLLMRGIWVSLHHQEVLLVQFTERRTLLMYLVDSCCWCLLLIKSVKITCFHYCNLFVTCIAWLNMTSFKLFVEHIVQKILSSCWGIRTWTTWSCLIRDLSLQEFTALRGPVTGTNLRLDNWLLGCQVLLLPYGATVALLASRVTLLSL